MIQRKVLIVSTAAGPERLATAVLARFGITSLVRAASYTAALDELRREHFALVIVPLENATPQELASLDAEVRRAGSTFVIGTAPTADPELILRALRAGVHEFVTHPPDETELAGAVERLMRRSRQEVGRGQVFAVFSPKGGLGATTISVNLAHALSRVHSEARVAVVDLLVQGGDVAVLLNAQARYHLGNLAEKLERVDADLLYSLLTPSAGVWVLPGPDDPELDDVIDGNAITVAIGHLRSHFGFTVIDCEHHLSPRSLAALDAADRVVVVTQLTVPALKATHRAIALCRRLGYPDEKLCVVANRVHRTRRVRSSEVLSLEDAAEALKFEIFHSLPNDYRAASESATQGVPVASLHPESKLAVGYLELASRLTNASMPDESGAQKGTVLNQLLGRLKRA